MPRNALAEFGDLPRLLNLSTVQNAEVLGVGPRGRMEA